MIDSPKNPRSATSGLATWRARQAEEKRLRMLELAHYREYATEEEIDGRVYRLVRIPDRYDAVRPVVAVPVQLRKGRKRT